MCRTLLLILLLLALTGCTVAAAGPPTATAVPPSATPAPTDVSPSATPPTESAASTSVAQAPPPTVTPRPTSTPRPTATRTPRPTATALPTLTPSPTPIVPCFPDPAPASRGRFGVVPGPWPRPEAVPGELYSGNSRSDLTLLHLGFDVEGDSINLGALLDVLDKHGVKTTMFVQGAWAEANPGWMESMDARGHEFANHTYSHRDISEMDAETLRQELNRTEEIIQALTGQTTRPWFRPPFGSRSQESVDTTFAAGWTTVIWTAGSEDWREDTNYQTMCDNLGDRTFPGAILYSHTNHPDAATAMDHFIYQMHSAGYTFVPMSVMMAPDPAAYLIP